VAACGSDFLRGGIRTHSASPCNASNVRIRADACKMGSDYQAVVDLDLKVHGLEGLRVCDSSIMPWLKAADHVRGSALPPAAELDDSAPAVAPAIDNHAA
jgi:hypothetical protein